MSSNKGPRFNELAIFVGVAESGSITAAARRLGTPKSTVARAIARLEESLGAVLVRRVSTGPALSEAGVQLFRRTAPHVAALRDATCSLARQENEVQGHLRVTTAPDIAELVLAPVVAAFVSKHPNVSVEVQTQSHIVDLVGEGFDLAIRMTAGQLESSSLIARRLGRIELNLYASPAYLAHAGVGVPRKPADLKHHEFISRSADTRPPLPLSGPGGTTQVSVGGRAASRDLNCVRALVLAGGGIGPLPAAYARRELETGNLIRVLPEYSVRGITAYVIHPPLRPLPVKLRAFRSFLLERAPPLLSRGE